MAKDLSAAMIAQIDASGRRPILLYTLTLDGLTVRYAGYSYDIVYNGETYTAKTIEYSGGTISKGKPLRKVSLTFDNTAGDMSSFISSYVFTKKALTISRIFLNIDDSVIDGATNYIELFKGEMNTPGKVTNKNVVITARLGKDLSRKLNKRKHLKYCQWTFGSKECNFLGYADLTSASITKSGTATGGTNTTLIDTGKLDQADNYWNYGPVQITKDTVVYTRRVEDSDQSSKELTLDIAVPFTIDGTCTYQVWKGCPKTWDACTGAEPWGPSGDNSYQFGGFIFNVDRSGSYYSTLYSRRNRKFNSSRRGTRK